MPDRVVSPDIDETPRRDEPPRLHAQRLARAKAAPSPRPAAIVLAADTVVAAGRRILPKAETEADARRCLALLSGRRHRVMTAVVLHAPDGRRGERLVQSVVGFARLTERADRRLPRQRRVARQGRRLCHPGPGGDASSASCPAAIPMSSACRCSRRRSCCAGWAGRCHDAAILAAASPGEVRVAVVA